MITPKIETLIDSPDSTEIVRDLIAAIILVESGNQAVLAGGAGQDPWNWKLRVFTEHSSPWSEFQEESALGSADSLPLVNVWLDSTQFAKSGSVAQQNGTATYNVDVYALGTARNVISGGHVLGDKDSALEAQRAARLVRKILMSAPHQYLGSPRGSEQIVTGRQVSEIQYFQPKADAKALQRVSAARIKLEVGIVETSPQVVPQILEAIEMTVSRLGTSEIFLRATYESSPAP